MRRATTPIASLVVFCLVGCGTSSTRTPAPHSAGTVGDQSVASLVGRPQGAVLRLPGGHAVRRFAITAVPHHEWDVRIGAPANTDFEVHARSSDGEWLAFLSSTRDRGCATYGKQLDCVVGPFAIGANVRPATWTVIVNKRSDPAATVHVQVTFPPLA